jgi:hypothetical protein
MTFEVPFDRRPGQPGMQPAPLVTLWVRSVHNQYVRMQFLVDSGADLAAVPVPDAETYGIPFNRGGVPGTVRGVAGRVPRFPGTLQVLIDGEAFVWPCVFLDVPADHPAAPVLGRLGLLSAFDVCFDEERVRLTRRRRGLRAWLRRLWTRRRIRQAGQPL